MDTDAYLTFLLVGLLLVAVDGQIIYRSGRRYLEKAYGDTESGASMTRLVTVLFHLVVLGVLALVSIVDIGGNSIEGVVGKLGVFLLILAVAHGLTLTVLGRIRDSQVGEDISARRANRVPGGPTMVPGQGQTVAPVPGQPGAPGPSVSPGLEHDAPER
ncbi:hypothetical protein [Amycolatopsis nigrescens]|uniref:hypothetical protein n=1 Tax=Amycolatopsis nigrescens TaxID=381445 RepID=UPI00038029D3|nr:hypothetical protein [Amycolatopsis nigrescens]